MDKRAQEQISKKHAAHYRNTFLNHGPTAGGVDWVHEDKARLRHHIFSKLIKEQHKTPPTLLDIGCGYGAFYDYLKGKALPCTYTGIDLVPEMIAHARTTHPDAHFLEGDFLSTSFEPFDYLFANGIFTQKLDVSQREMNKLLHLFLKRMFALCTKGIALNMMTSQVNFYAENLFYKNPAEMIAYVMEVISDKFLIHHEYELYEFTLFIYK